MSVLELVTPVHAPSGPTWSRVSPTLWVASVGGEFLGTVEQLGERFVGCDGRALELGTFADLETAKQRVLHPASSRAAHRRTEGAADEPRVAWALACLAAFAFAVTVLTVAQGFLS
jgi:hypothetical protein